MRKSILAVTAAVMLVTSTAAHAGYRDTWHGGIVGIDICYNNRGLGHQREQWKFAGVAMPCFALS